MAEDPGADSLQEDDLHHSIVPSSLNLETEHLELMGKCLLPSDYYRVFYILHTFAEKWKRFASFLKLPATTLDVIMEEHGEDNMKALSKVVSLWLARSYNTKEFGQPCLDMVVKAVADSAGVTVESVAQNIIEEYFTKNELPTGASLHQACAEDNISLLKRLILQHKADVSTKYYDNNSPLHVAALNGKEEVTLALIEQFGCDVEVKGYNGRSVLHQVCVGGNISLVESLILKHKANVSARDNDNNTPLHVAALKGKEEVASTLINQYGCDVEVRGYKGRSVLHQACVGGSVTLVESLILRHKANISASDKYCNKPIHVAVLNGKEEVALALINQFGCDVEVKGYNGRSVLHLACAGGNVSLVESLILKHKASINTRDDDDNTPLYVAALNGKEEVVLALISQFGCDVDVKGHFGRSPLHWACYNGHVNVVKAIGKYAYLLAVDDNGDTPLHVCSARGHVECVKALLALNTSVLVRNIQGKTPREVAETNARRVFDNVLRDQFGCNPNHLKKVLHHLCKYGHVGLVKIAILEYKADINARDNDCNTPLHVAALNGKEEISLALINQFDCDVEVKGYKGRSVLHQACAGGINFSLIKSLILKYKANVNARDDDNNTPLHVAALSGNEEVALSLINQFGCDLDVKGYLGRSPLHWACYIGHVKVVKAIGKYASLLAVDDDGDTPLHVCSARGHVACVKALLALNAPVLMKNKLGETPRELANAKIKQVINEFFIDRFGYDARKYGDTDKLILHHVGKEGHISQVQSLVQDHKCNYINVRNDDNNTPLHVAVLSGKEEIALALTNEFDCDVNVKGCKGRSVLHYACLVGNVSLVESLVLKHKADFSTRDDDNNTPLDVAALSGNEEVSLFLINQFDCHVSAKGCNGRSVLHCACLGGNVSLVESLIVKHKANVNARDDDNNTPLHVAALSGNEEVTLFLNQIGCDVDGKGYSGRSALHYACYYGHVNVVTAIGKYASLLAVDDDGDTPLHVCSARGHAECVKALLALNAPVLMRNKQGKTPKEETTFYEIKSTLREYQAKNRGKILTNYKSMQERARKRYSKPGHITRVIVIGNPGGGKSSFIQSLKREGFFESFFKVSESSVPPHTAGIVPSLHSSKHYGRVLFYDFAGDPEYYSSHATILENLSSLIKGSNIFVIVADVRENDDTIGNMLHYWFSFIQNQKFLEEIISLVLIGSHVDIVGNNEKRQKGDIFRDFKEYVQSRVPYRCAYYMLDCCYPRGVGEIQQFLKTLTSDSPLYSLSIEASMLLGLLEKDFSNVTACSLHTLLSHIEEIGLALPKSSKSLCSVLHELHELGLLLVIGDRTEGDVQVILDISQLTNNVHQSLFALGDTKFSRKCEEKLGSSSSAGIIPESILLEVLPEYITKECLIQLQYCQEISHSDIGVFPPIPQTSTPNESFLFFPALCRVDKSKASFNETFPDTSYSIGWLAQCSEPHDHFPPRFLHVLLLRLIFNFSIKASSDKPVSSEHHCTLWKTGVQWPMPGKGVLCMVELVKDSKEVVVITKSGQDHIENCVSTFNQIVSCVMEAKAEFCHSIKPKFFLLASTKDEEYVDRDNLITMSKVEEVLTSSENIAFIPSITGKRSIKVSKLQCMQRLTHWNSLFPIDFNSVLHLLKSVDNISDLCIYLDIPHHILREAEFSYPRDVSQIRRQVLWWWWTNCFRSPPCWYDLVKALKAMGKNTLAKEITENNSPHVEVQKNLLDQENHSHSPDVKFLELFSQVVGSKWPSLASLLSLTGREIEEVKQEGEGLPHQHHAYLMLKKWVSKEGASYGELYQKLRTISLFQYGHH